MAGGDAAKLENEKQKNLADQQDQSPHKDAPRWNEALAVSPFDAITLRIPSSMVRKRDESGRCNGGTVDDRGFGLMKGRFRMLIHPNVVFLLLSPSDLTFANLELYPYRLPCFPFHVPDPSTSLPSQISIMIYPTATTTQHNLDRIQLRHTSIPSQSESEAVIKADTSSKKVDPKDLQGETVEHVKKVHGH